MLVYHDDNDKPYFGFAKFNIRQDIPFRQGVSTYIVFVNDFGDLHVWVVQKGSNANGFTELKRFYQANNPSITQMTVKAVKISDEDINCNKVLGIYETFTFKSELSNMKDFLLQLSENDELLEVARKAIEDELIELRDSRIGIFFRNNGLVVKERDGKSSDVIRMGPEHAVMIALKAIAARLEQ